MLTYKQLLKEAAVICEGAQVNEQLSRRLLLELCDEFNVDLYMNIELPVDVSLKEKFDRYLIRLCNHEPLAYILGYEWFFGRKFECTEDVLVPREETEELVGHILADIDEFFDSLPITIADVGTGSGALAITTKLELQECDIFASDISVEALSIAKKNAEKLSAEVTFLQGDMAQPLIDQRIFVDVCLCNPPYIKNSEEIQLSVQAFEPHVALFGGVDGLDLYRRILDQVPRFMKQQSILAFEMGYDQKESLVYEVKSRFPDSHVIVRQDINGLDRMCFVYFNRCF